MEGHSFFNNQSISDPTRTLTLRSRWAADWMRRIKALKKAIHQSIVVNDAFGLREPNRSVFAQADLPPAAPGQWAYRWSQEKVDTFMLWLQEMESKGLLEITLRGDTLRMGGEPWSNIYVRSSYQRGLQYALDNVRKVSWTIGQQLGLPEGALPPTFAPSGGAVSTLMMQPFHSDRVALAYTRVFEELKGVTAAMDQQISRVLTQGLAQGLNPNDIGKMIEMRVDAIGAVRGRLIARTETIHIHQQAALNEYYAAEEMTGEVFLVQWKAVMDSRTRDTHAERNMRVYTKPEAYAIIGEPNCRCALLPYIPAVQGVPPKATEAARALAIKAVEQAKKTVSGGIGKEVIGEPGVAESGLVKEPPMSSIEKLANCIATGMLANEILWANKPQSCNDYYRDSGKWYYQGKEVIEEESERLNKMRIPPAWSDVVVSKDPTARIQAIGLDSAGRWQYRYSAEHVEEMARIKFDRIKSFERDISAIRRAIDDGIADGDPRAYLARLEDKTAIRAGSMSDFKAKQKAYGITTLKNEHILIDGDVITLDFVAKEGIPAHYELKDKVLADWLKARKALLSSPDDFMFPDVSASKLNAFIRECAGGKEYSIKDFRTLHGTIIAREELMKYAGQTLTDKEKKKIVKEVCEIVSNMLKNTPTMAKTSYIDPMVWEIIGGLP